MKGNTTNTITVTWNLDKGSRYAKLSDGSRLVIPSEIRKAHRNLQMRLKKLQTMDEGDRKDIYEIGTDGLQMRLAFMTFRWINRIIEYLSSSWYQAITFKKVRYGNTSACMTAWEKFEEDMRRKASRSGKTIEFGHDIPDVTELQAAIRLQIKAEERGSDETRSRILDARVERIVSLMPDPVKKPKVKVESLTQNERQLRIIQCMRKNPTITLDRIVEKAKIPRSTLVRDVARLTKQGYVKRNGNSRSGSWVVTESNSAESTGDCLT